MLFPVLLLSVETGLSQLAQEGERPAPERCQPGVGGDSQRFGEGLFGRLDDVEYIAMNQTVGVSKENTLDGAVAIPQYRDIFNNIRQRPETEFRLLVHAAKGAFIPAAATRHPYQKRVGFTGWAIGRRLRDIASDIIWTGDAVSSTANTLTLDATASAVDGSYDPSVVITTGGTGAGQVRGILEYFGTAANGNANKTMVP